MNTEMNYHWQMSKKHVVALSCATALATFTLVARPTFADEVKIPEATGQPTEILTPAQETVVTNVEVKAPTTNPISTNAELPTSTSTVLSEAPSSEAASSELASESPVEITSEQEFSNQDNQANKATPIKTATSEASATKTSSEKVTEPVPVEETKTPTKNSEQPAPIEDNEKPVIPAVTLENAPHISGGHYYSDDNGNWYYKDANGKNLVGLNYVDNVPVYFSQDGIQIKGGFAEDGRYYDKDSGALVTNSFVHVYNWNYQNQDGNHVNHFVITIPNNSVVGPNGENQFLDMSHYPLSSNDLNREDFYYYVDDNGDKLTGPQTLNGIHVYFDQNGRQLRGEFEFDEDGTVHYYDAKNGARAENTIVRTNTGAFKFDANGNGHLMKLGEEIDTPVTPTPTVSLDKAPRVFGGHYYSDNEGNWYYKDANGKNLIGLNFVDNIPVYFDKDGKQVKGRFAEDGRYYDKNSGALVTKRYLETEDGNWVYVNDKGDKLKGEQTIDGVKVYFDDFTGTQVKGHFAPNGKYYDKDSGALVTNAFKEILTYIGRDDINNQNIYTTAWYYLDADGKPLTGPQTFGNSRFYFLPNGAQVKGRFAPDGHYYDKDSGALVTDSFVHVYNWNYRNLDGDRIFHFTITIPGNDTVDQDGQYPRESKDLDREDFYYYVDAKGDKLTGPQTLNGIHVYFDQNGKQLRGEFKFDDDGTVHYYDAKNGARAENTIVRTNTGAFKFDADGNGHLMGPGEV
ncbi:glucosyl transferase [Streptococcus salivarius]|uniref:glucosyl transferase n=2 Tax=Streptococcus salivarius TaxID=1304 RepID=UPI003978BADE